MLLDIKLIKTTSMFCIESAAASVSTWLNRNYEMMFCRMWGFDFLKEDPNNPGVIGNRITAGFNDADMFELYRHYHGININVWQVKHIDVVDKIISELQKEMPVAVLLKKQYLPWFNWDQNPISGFILIIGYEKDTFLYLDIHNNILDIKPIPMVNFLESKLDTKDSGYTLFFFSVVGNEKKQVTLKDFLSNFKKSMVNREKAFDSMRNLAECIRIKLDLNLEKGSINNPYYVPLLFNIMEVLRARKLLSSTLNYIGTKTNNDYLNNLAMEFLWIGGEWNSIWNLLNKSYYIQELGSDKLQKLQLKIANKISEIANNEELLINKVINCNFDIIGKKFFRRMETFPNTVICNDKIVFIDVADHLNNKAFAFNESNDDGADFTGQGEFFLGYGLPDNNMFVIDGMKFFLSSNNGFDNISCRDQLIKIPEGYYQRIMFLGCSEWGEGFGQVRIFYSDGQIENILLHLPDWYNNGVIEVTRAWKGQIRGLNQCKDERSLFAVSYELSREVEIERIQLPEIENIHIFSISLEKIS